jgi:hypothetical protein
VAELRRGIEGGVNHLSIHHGMEVGGGSARRGVVTHVRRWRRWAGSGWMKGVTP